MAMECVPALSMKVRNTIGRLPGFSSKPPFFSNPSGKRVCSNSFRYTQMLSICREVLRPKILLTALPSGQKEGMRVPGRNLAGLIR